MRTTLIQIAAALFTVAAPISMHAQDPAALVAGTRVKLRTPVLDAAQQVGRVVGVTGDTILFRADAYPVTRTLTMSDITSMEVSAGTVSNKGKFALIGTAIGAAIGVATGYHESGGNGGQFIGGGKKSAGENALYSAALGGAFGALTGWLVGRSHSSERWVAAPVRSR